jgi:thiamine biosynthesis lipoprotein
VDVVWSDFRVMASAARVILVDPAPGALDQAQRRLDELEQHWSRFLANSDLSRLIRSPDVWTPVAPDTITLIESMQRGSSLTSGSYDPTMLHEIVAEGYVASIDDPNRLSIVVDLPSLVGSVHDVGVDSENSMVRLPTGLGLDPGGIGKGLAADIVVAELLHAGTGGALVSVGGDLAAAGTPPAPDGWLVNVEHPLDPTTTLTTLAVSAGGVATSSTRTRRWNRDGVSRHHVLDPVSGRSSTSDLAAVTVVASAGWLAEIHATAALVAGSAGAMAHLAAHGLSGIVTTLDGETSVTADLGAVLAGVSS